MQWQYLFCEIGTQNERTLAATNEFAGYGTSKIPMGKVIIKAWDWPEVMSTICMESLAKDSDWESH